MRLVSSKQMQEMDRYTIEKIGIPGIVLMENAARSWIEAVEPFLHGDCKIHVFCGSGNNGGDGYILARHLFSRGVDVQVVMLSPASRLRGDARRAYAMAQAYGVPLRPSATPQAWRRTVPGRSG